MSALTEDLCRFSECGWYADGVEGAPDEVGMPAQGHAVLRGLQRQPVDTEEETVVGEFRPPRVQEIREGGDHLPLVGACPLRDTRCGVWLCDIQQQSERSAGNRIVEIQSFRFAGQDFCLISNSTCMHE